MTKASNLTLASFFLNFLFLTSLSAQCPIGNVFLTSQTNVDNYVAFYGSCTEIDGGLYIGSFSSTGSDIHDLSGLVNLKKINHGLLISNCEQLTSLDGFAALEEIGNAITLSGNSNLLDLKGLSSVMHEVNELIINNNDALTNLIGLESIKVMNSLNIANNAQLQTTEGLICYKNLNYITLESNPALEDVSGLGLLEKATQFKINNNASLPNLDGLEKLTIISNDLTIVNNPALTSINGLNNLSAMDGALNLINNPLLASLNGLENLTAVGQLTIDKNNSLTTTTGLNNLSYVNSIVILDNANLSSLAGFTNVTTLSFLTISENPGLIDLNGFSGLTTVNNQLKITENANLLSLDGLENLSKVIGVFELDQHMKLKDIQSIALTDLLNASLTITNNPLLKVCAVSSVCNHIDIVPSFSTINNNDLGCKSIAEVQIACGIILTVEMTDFVATQIDEEAFLKWETSTEHNNLGFDVERSSDGINWTSIGWVAGKGAGHYQFKDEHPKAGANYYRLQQIDFNGFKSSTGVQQLYFKTDDDTIISYPNPAVTTITIEVPTSKRLKDEIIQLFDLTGKLQQQWHLSSTQKTQVLNLQGLPSGLYIIRIADLQQKIVVGDAF